FPPIRNTGRRPEATSEFRATMTARCPSATSVSGCFRERENAPLGNDVPPVFHLGCVVRDDGYVSRPNAALHRPPDWSRLRSDGDCRSGIAVFHGGRRLSVLLEREASRPPAPDRRHRDVSRLAADDVRDFLP